MVDQLNRECTVSGSARPDRNWPVLLIVAVVVALAVLGTWALVAITASDETAVAGDLVDDFLSGLNNADGAAAAALFTEDGTFDMRSFRTYQGRESIAAAVGFWSAYTEDFERVGDVVETEARSFTFVARGDYFASHGANPNAGPWELDGEIELDGDLIARLSVRGHPPED